MNACRQRRKGATTTRLTRSTQLPELAVVLRLCDDSVSKCIMQAALNSVSAIRRDTKSHARHTTRVMSAEDTRRSDTIRQARVQSMSRPPTNSGPEWGVNIHVMIDSENLNQRQILKRALSHSLFISLTRSHSLSRSLPRTLSLSLSPTHSYLLLALSL